MKSTKKIVSLILAAVLVLSMFVVTSISVNAADVLTSNTGSQSMSGNFNKNYTVTGDGATDMVNIAMAQNERTKAQLGYTESWCADFVSDCAKLAGQSAAIPFDGYVPTMYNSVISAGGQVVASAKAGDLVFFSNGSGYGHVGIAIDGSRNISGNINYNNTGVIKVCVLENRYEGYSSWTFVRPNYKGSTPVPYVKPEIVKAYINYQTASSYRVNVVVKNQQCIESVRLATWTNQAQTDLHWNYCHFNGYDIYFFDVARSDYSNNAKCYINDAYVRDTKGQDIGSIRVITNYSDPKIVKTYINYQTKDSYRVNVQVENRESISSVRLATWTTQNQSDLHWNYCHFNGYTIYFFDVSRSDFASNAKTYINDVYLYDANENIIEGARVFTEYKDAKLEDVRVTKLSSKGYRVVAKVNSQFSLASAQYPTWTLSKDQDDLIWHSAVVSGNYISGYIKASDHNNETSRYITHIYVTDSIGQTFSFSNILPYINLTDEVNEIDSITYSNHKYALYNHEFTWTEAKEWCKSQGGHLVTIGDSNEWEAIKELLSKNGGIPVWLGGERITGTNSFKWVDDTAFSFDNWEENQPDNGGNSENYIGTHNGDYFLDCYSWNDYGNDNTRIGGFICEYDEVETPTEPISSENNPTEPSSSDSQPTEPTSSESQPTSSESNHTEPSSSESQPTEPTSSESQPTEPSSSESQPTETQPSKTDISKWNVSGIKNKTYTGRVIKQDNIIVLKDGEYADFSVKYKNNLNVGTATVTITGTGDYTGTIVKTFKITKAVNPISVKVTAKTIKLSAIKKKAQTVKAITVSKAQGKVSYKLTSVPKALKKFVKINSKGVITISKWAKAKKGTYKIKVKISAAGNKNYNSKEINKIVTIKVK